MSEHLDHNHTIYFIGPVLIDSCRTCQGSDVIFVAPFNEDNERSNAEALRAETRSTYAVTG